MKNKKIKFKKKRKLRKLNFKINLFKFIFILKKIIIIFIL